MADDLLEVQEAVGTTTISVADALPEIVSDEENDELKLILGEFVGPLDLLLYLIRQEQVDIYDIPITRITDEYLKYLQLMKELDISLAGDFLVMASQLIELKSRMLLPRTATSDDEEEMEDPRKDLINQLLEHQKFKAAAQMLWSRAQVEQAVFRRAELETDTQNPEVSAGVFDLLRVFQQILDRHKEKVHLDIEREEISMAEMLERLRNAIFSAGEISLLAFFEHTASRGELVLAFLSVLELVRTTQITLVQKETFGDIIARATNQG